MKMMTELNLDEIKAPLTAEEALSITIESLGIETVVERYDVKRTLDKIKEVAKLGDGAIDIKWLGPLDITILKRLGYGIINRRPNEFTIYWT